MNFSKIFFISALLGVFTLSAQDMTGVAIAATIRPTSDELDSYTTCVVKLKEAGLKPEIAADKCRAAKKDALGASKKIAINAAKAAKANRPMVIQNGCCGYGYGGYNGGTTVIYSGSPRYHSAPRSVAPPPSVPAPYAPPPPSVPPPPSIPPPRN